MPKPSNKSRAYKTTTLQQLRSFCETARLGSLTAAADFLGLAHPTVWQQVHTLEREFGEKLIEPSRRGCRLTAAGHLLAELANPSLLHLSSLKSRFQEARGLLHEQLTVAATPRAVMEELSECVLEFERRQPRVQFVLKEMRSEEIDNAVESGQADLGLTPERTSDLGKLRQSNPWLVFEPCYELDHILVTPKDHPLARRRRVLPRDLEAYPLMHSRISFHNPVIMALLDRFGVQTPPHGRRVETIFAATMCRYVELGFGIALIGGRAGRRMHPHLHERVMSRYFGRATIYLVRRKGAPQTPTACAFIDAVKRLLNSTAAQ